MREICLILDIDKLHTSYYHPETNAIAERFHGTLNSMMGKVVQEHHQNWDHHLPFVMAAYRATIHQSTGYSPNYLMFARENRAPADLVFSIPRDETSTSYDDYSAEMEEKQKQAYQLVRQHLGTAAERMKHRYDLRVKPQKFVRGQWVLYYNPRRIQGRQQKWERRYLPHLIIKELPPVNYLIQKNKRSRPFICHVDKLKFWETDNPPKSWLSDQSNDETEVKTPVLSENNRSQPASFNNNRYEGDDRFVAPFDSHPVQMNGEADYDNDEYDREERVAIAGDPTSAPQLRVRPPRAIRRPVRYLCDSSAMNRH